MKGHLICPACGAQYPEKEAAWQCACGSYLDLAYTFTPHKANFAQASSPGHTTPGHTTPGHTTPGHITPGHTTPAHSTFLRYKSILPLDRPEQALGFNESATPVMETEWEGRPVHLKLDYLMASGSFKDRGAYVLINKCRELGIKSIVVDSSGNSACSASAYSALAGIEAHIYMPAGNSSGKTRQVSAYGATLYKIPGSRLDTAKAAEKATATHYYAAHTRNPYFLHGTKTAAYELMEQSGWVVPEAVFIPVGSGSLLLGMHLGFTEMIKAGLIDRYPRLMAVQSEHCNPIRTALDMYANAAPGTKITAADIMAALPPAPTGTVLPEGIANSHPPRIDQIVRAVLETKGDVLVVTDKEVIEALRTATSRGLYIEPTSASALAALKHYKSTAKHSTAHQTGHSEDPQEHLQAHPQEPPQEYPQEHPQGQLVVMLTGHGLKAAERIEEILEHT